MLFSFYCENSSTAPSGYYFMEYGLKWLFKGKRLPTLGLEICLAFANPTTSIAFNMMRFIRPSGIFHIDCLDISMYDME